MKRFLFKITMLLFILLLIYTLSAFTGCVIENAASKMKITQAAVTGFDYYITATDPDLFFDEIEKINKKRIVPYFIDKKPLEQTVKLLKDTFYIHKTGQRFILVARKDDFYLFIENIAGYLKYRMNLFFKETFQLKRDSFSVSIQREKNHYFKEISRIKLLPRNPATGLLPPAVIEHTVFASLHYNGVWVSAKKETLLQVAPPAISEQSSTIIPNLTTGVYSGLLPKPIVKPVSR